MLTQICGIVCLVLMAVWCLGTLCIWVRTRLKWRQLQKASPVVSCRAKLEIVYRYRRRMRTVFLTADGQRVGLAAPDDTVCKDQLREGRECMLTYKGDSICSLEWIAEADEAEGAS